MTSLTGYSGPTGGNMQGNATPRGPRGAGPGDIIPKGYRKAQIQQFTPEAMNLYKNMFGLVSPDSYLSKLAGGDEATFEQMEAPALRQFAGLQGNLASRFSGMGSTGARRSSGFQNTLTSAASDFAQDLASRRSELQRQALLDMVNISKSLLSQRPTEQFIAQKRQKNPSSFGTLLGGGLGAIGGGILGGPAGAATGFGIGSSLGNLGSGSPGAGSNFANQFGGYQLPGSWNSLVNDWALQGGI